MENDSKEEAHQNFKYDPEASEKVLFSDLQQQYFSELLGQSYEIETEIEDESDCSSSLDVFSVEGEAFSLIDEEDKKIILHREVHFGGSFPVMQEYYANEDHRGVMDDISPERIKFLADVEVKLGKNLAPFLLSGSDAEHIARAKKLYKSIEHAINQAEEARKTDFSSGVKVDLLTQILFEEGNKPWTLEQMQQFKEFPEILFTLAASDEFRDELSPGYGKAPLEAIRLIGQLQISKGMDILFRVFPSASDDEEEVLIAALVSFGSKALDKTTQYLTSRPITPLHEKMASLLVAFLPNQVALNAALNMLCQRDIIETPVARWLLLVLEDLPKEERRTWVKKFQEMKLPKHILDTIEKNLA